MWSHSQLKTLFLNDTIKLMLNNGILTLSSFFFFVIFSSISFFIFIFSHLYFFYILVWSKILETWEWCNWNKQVWNIYRQSYLLIFLLPWRHRLKRDVSADGCEVQILWYLFIGSHSFLCQSTVYCASGDVRRNFKILLFDPFSFDGNMQHGPLLFWTVQQRKSKAFFNKSIAEKKRSMA